MTTERHDPNKLSPAAVALSTLAGIVVGLLVAVLFYLYGG